MDDNALFQDIISSPQFDPHQILGVPKYFTDMHKLRKNFRKRMLKYHPDRSKGSTLKYNIVMHSYTLLVEDFTRRKTDKTDYELKKAAQKEVHQSNVDERMRRSVTESFDVNKFNRAFTDNRLDDESVDVGYGDFMTKTVQLRQPKLKGKVSGDAFKEAFRSHKRSVAKKNKNKLVVYKEPEAHVTGKLKYSEIDTRKKKDYSSEGLQESVQFSDLKKVFSEDGSLLAVGVQGRRYNPASVQELQSHRKNVAHTMSEADVAKAHALQRRAQKQEQMRLRRIQERDDLVSSHYAKVNQRLLQQFG